ncbi:response regulator [Pseudobacteriovorax antillogorgiicola]|uniref:CheY chemotaxis protein or a CheY-like REC (Receiver) domain n=1 Tax=Pseudobacteriovorax antillogorgiicola TaxID=1513793 RepID=A0A1Y6BM33_9BACT|nr:response regulator [Pseudobacteriovorax antillogorgiicola]TCS54676.1 CheY-like chemotaxis protein [Pseudobacteriovorax antillogorgiicola]SMF16630.1 CheY chemotaxis protein or a CheY-like REC (receiver) domain [Pseudobacteriovorax antillogorgiicola]
METNQTITTMYQTDTNQNRRPKIILLDDDKLYCVLFKKQVQAHADCDFATRADGFFRKLDQHDYDFALVDFNLRESNCLSITQEAAKKYNIPVIVISSSFANLMGCSSLEPSIDSIQGYLSKWEQPDTILFQSLRQLEFVNPDPIMS